MIPLALSAITAGGPFTGPGPATMQYDAATDTGYFGEVLAADLITGSALATEIGLTAGTSISDSGWLKFFVGESADCNRDSVEKILFVSKKTLRHSIQWDEINTARAVDGSGSQITIDGHNYKVRLLLGAEANPTASDQSGGCSLNRGAGSEWNALVYRVHSDMPTCADDSAGMPNGSETTAHGGAQSGANWASLLDSDMAMIPASGNGSFAWCQETTSNSLNRVARGFYGIAGFSHAAYYQGNSAYGWRPCLELVRS